jgi:toxin ParE1/3/4
MALATFPQRGTRHDDISRGLRTIGFERRDTIVFQVTRAEVAIVRICYGGRDYESALRGTTEE